jgi:hypothetical protein
MIDTTTNLASPAALDPTWEYYSPQIEEERSPAPIGPLVPPLRYAMASMDQWLDLNA